MATTAAVASRGLGDRSARLDQHFCKGGLGGFQAVSDVAGCLIPLLKALGWRGDPGYLAVALPHFADHLDVEGLRAVMANLNYVSRPARTRIGRIDLRLLPCLFVPDIGPAMVVLAQEDGGPVVLRGDIAEIATPDRWHHQGTAYFFHEAEVDVARQNSPARSQDWFTDIVRRFRGLVGQMLLVTFFNSLLAVAVPLFIMAIYDKVIPANSHRMLLFLCFGMAIAILVDLALRIVRGRLLAYLGGRIDVLMGSAVFQQVMHLPIEMTESASIGAQLARLRQFDTIREFFTGPLAGVALELPFVVMFIAVIAMVGGPLAWIPIVLLVLFLVIGVVLVPAMRRSVTAGNAARAQRQVFLIETLTHSRMIKTNACEPLWSRRYRELSAQTAIRQLEAGQVSQLAQTLAQVLMTGAGVATLGIGAVQVIAGDLSVGALVATMALVWRVLSPLQMTFLGITRVEQTRSIVQQINQLMRLPREREPGSVPNRLRRFRGGIAFNRVSLRHTPTAEPALMGASLTIEPGKLVVITGTNGSGKTTLLRVVAGLYKPQAGTVLIDDLDIRQLDVAELRAAVAFVPQTSQLFHGTIAQNLRLANPIATDQDLERAVADAGLLDDLRALPEGFDTRMSDKVQRQLPNGFKQRLMLARAYVKNSPIVLLDEPGRDLDTEGDAALLRKLEGLKGTSTVVMVTHRPSHMRIADQIVYLSGGQVLVSGPPNEVLPKLGLG